MIVSAFSHEIVDVRLAILKTIPSISKLIEYEHLKGAVLPQLKVL